MRRVRIAAASSVALRSAFLISTIFRTCSRVTLPTLSRLGTPEPLANPASFFSSAEAGGLLNTREKLRSAYTVMTTGMIRPALS